MSYYVDLRVMDYEQPVREMNRMWEKVKDFRLPGQALRTFDAGDSKKALADRRGVHPPPASRTEWVRDHRHHLLPDETD